MRAAVVGAGSWGTVVAGMLARAGARTALVCRTEAQAEAIRERGVNPGVLRGVRVPASVAPTHLGDPDALRDAELIAMAVPSRATGEAVAWLAGRIPAGAAVLCLTKGLDPASGRRLSQAYRDALGPEVPFAALSGPNHAEEIALGQPTAAVVAGDAALVVRVQDALAGPRFRLYPSTDLVGVELCAAAKNVIALAAGMSDGVGFGDNCKATLITRGLAEMTRLGEAYGARAATFRGLAGMGDLVATCTSRHSRNRAAGALIARGTPADRVEGELGQVAEGIWTARNLLGLAAGAAVELPISAEVAAATHDGKPVLACLEALMARAPAAEE